MVFRGTTAGGELGGVTNGRLPNITASVGLFGVQGFTNIQGAFYNNGNTGVDVLGHSARISSVVLGFSAARVASVYADDFNGVRPKSILVYFLIKYI